MIQRRKGREYALQCLYSLEVGQGSQEDAEAKILEGLNPDTDSLKYGRKLTQLVLDRVLDIDARLSSHSQNWELNRIAIIDKILIRCAAAEMLYLEEIPLEVSITEAIQLGLKYSTENSSKFINGVLDGMAKQFSNLKPKD